MTRLDVLASFTRLSTELDDFWQRTQDAPPAPVRPAVQAVMCQECGRYMDPDDVGLWFESAGVGIDERGDLVERGAPVAVLAAVAYCRECRR